MTKPTEKQTNARLKNWSKGLLIGMIATLRRIISYKDISVPAKEYLKDASQLINNALKEWNNRGRG
jgi:hypothetical protein